MPFVWRPGPCEGGLDILQTSDSTHESSKSQKGVSMTYHRLRMLSQTSRPHYLCLVWIKKHLVLASPNHCTTLLVDCVILPISTNQKRHWTITPCHCVIPRWQPHKCCTIFPSDCALPSTHEMFKCRPDYVKLLHHPTMWLCNTIDIWGTKWRNPSLMIRSLLKDEWW